MNISVLTPISHLNGVHEILNKKGNIFYNENANKEEAKKHLLLNDIDVIICNPNKQGYIIDEELLKDTKVKIINTCSTGVNHIDVKYCIDNNIKVQSLTNDLELINDLPSTSELAFGLLLDLSRYITKSHNDYIKYNKWDYTNYIGNQIKDMNIGIVGFGRLGKMMAKYCNAFEANVFVYDPYINKQDIKYNVVGKLEELFDISDSVSLHIHASEMNRGIINFNLLNNHPIKYLINTSRGEIVNEHDIVIAMENGVLNGYATDVICDEFGDITKSPFYNRNDLNLIITQHIGGMTLQGQTKAYKWSINKL